MSAPPSSTETFETAKRHFFDGLAHLHAGRFDQAEQQFLASLALMPQRVSTLVNLAATRLRLGRPQPALSSADDVLAIEPGNTDALLHRGTALLMLHRPAEALASFDRLLAVDPRHAVAWSQRGSILREAHRLPEAAQAFEQALAHGADPVLNRYYLASVTQQTLQTAPAEYVEALFDDYAEQFDEHLVQQLRYRIHEALVQHVVPPASGRFTSALDLGCGTGLCGPLVRPLAAWLLGIDLSAQMLNKARARGVYDELVQADIVQHLQKAGERHDLVLAADVFIYVGDLAPVFAAVRRALPPGGVFCFSAEEAASAEAPAGYRLLPSLRYAHTEPYLCELAAAHGFQVRQLLREPIREDQREPVEGLLAYLST
jgi:predicted TPR repeat methyltransferase